MDFKLDLIKQLENLKNKSWCILDTSEDELLNKTVCLEKGDKFFTVTVRCSDPSSGVLLTPRNLLKEIKLLSLEESLIIKEYFFDTTGYEIGLNTRFRINKFTVGEFTEEEERFYLLVIPAGITREQFLTTFGGYLHNVEIDIGGVLHKCCIQLSNSNFLLIRTVDKVKYQEFDRICRAVLVGIGYFCGKISTNYGYYCIYNPNAMTIDSLMFVSNFVGEYENKQPLIIFDQNQALRGVEPCFMSKKEDFKLCTFMLKYNQVSEAVYSLSLVTVLSFMSKKEDFKCFYEEITGETNNNSLLIKNTIFSKLCTLMFKYNQFSEAVYLLSLVTNSSVLIDLRGKCILYSVILEGLTAVNPKILSDEKETVDEKETIGKLKSGLISELNKHKNKLETSLYAKLLKEFEGLSKYKKTLLDNLKDDLMRVLEEYKDQLVSSSYDTLSKKINGLDTKPTNQDKLMAPFYQFNILKDDNSAVTKRAEEIIKLRNSFLHANELYQPDDALEKELYHFYELEFLVTALFLNMIGYDGILFDWSYLHDKLPEEIRADRSWYRPIKISP